MKKILGLVLVLALCLALGGCQSITNFFDGFSQLFGGRGGAGNDRPASSESLPASSSSRSTPPASSRPEPASSSSEAPAAQAPAEEEPVDVGFGLNGTLVSLPHMMNSEFKEIFDPDLPVDAQIIMGGIPYLPYYDAETDVYMIVEFVEGNESLALAWENAERRDDYMPGYNCFPDDCQVAYVTLTSGSSGGLAFLDFLFIGEGEKNYDTICQFFGQYPEMTLQPADPPEYENSEMYQAYDMQYCVFTYEDVNIRLNYTDYGAGYEFTSITLYIDDPYGMFR